MTAAEISRQELRMFFDAKIPMCGCGNPGAGVALIHKLLHHHPLYEHIEEKKALLPDVGLEMLILGMLDAAELNEHGGGIGGSWLTPLGKRVRDALDRELATHPDDLDPFDSFTASACIHGYSDQPEDAGHDCMAADDPVIPCETEEP
jgi:hypothetical protein